MVSMPQQRQSLVVTSVALATCNLRLDPVWCDVVALIHAPCYHSKAPLIYQSPGRARRP